MDMCLYRADVVSASAVAKLNGPRPNAICAQTGTMHTETVEEHFDFAVGFSRQPLPIGNRFAIVTKASGPRIMATDAPTRYGLELTTLRPETIESLKAKLPPTANFPDPVDANHERHRAVRCLTGQRFQAGSTEDAGKLLKATGGESSNISTVEDARVGFKKITNGVKQRAPGARLLGVEVVHGKGEGARAADIRIVLTPSQFP
jgi:acyl-CoA synthetase (NDP forming)